MTDEKGVEVRIDLESVDRIKNGAEKGDAGSLYILAQAFIGNYPQEKEKAVLLWKKAADQGSAMAVEELSHLGIAYNPDPNSSGDVKQLIEEAYKIIYGIALNKLRPWIEPGRGGDFI